MFERRRRNAAIRLPAVHPTPAAWLHSPISARSACTRLGTALTLPGHVAEVVSLARIPVRLHLSVCSSRIRRRCFKEIIFRMSLHLLDLSQGICFGNRKA